MKKHAFLIEAHDNREQVEKLFKCLDYEANDVFLHIDAKSSQLEEIERYKFLNAGFYVIPPIRVFWGGYSQIAAELSLLEAAAEKGRYIRYHLISGADLPLVSQEKLHEFFDSMEDTEFIHCDNVVEQMVFEKRMAQYHFLRDHIVRGGKVLEALENALCYGQKALRINRIKSLGIKLMKGSNWFSITDNCVRYVLERKKWIEKTFQYTKCCDEVFLQTIVWNSPFKDKMFYDKVKKKYSNAREIDWSRGTPYTYRKGDFDQLINSQCMFARKFDSRIDGEIVDMLVDHVTRG